MIRSLIRKQNRPNYAKRAKDFGLKYISIRNIQKYFDRDWEKRIESSEQRFNWEYIAEYLIRRDIMEMSHLQFSDFINELISEGLPIKERRLLRRKNCVIRNRKRFRQQIELITPPCLRGYHVQ